MTAGSTADPGRDLTVDPLPEIDAIIDTDQDGLAALRTTQREQGGSFDHER